MSRMSGQLSDDGRLMAPSSERNKGPILEVLRRVLPPRGLVLEVASGTGQHVAHFAAALPALEWQPSDLDERHLASIAAWIRHAGLANIRTPVRLDVESERWPLDRADAVLCVNMIHIAPWSAAEALVHGAARVLAPRGVLFLYGPYRRFGRHTAPSNEAFDADLRARNPAWGLRDMETVIELAAANGLSLVDVVDMPANNFSVVFENRRMVE